MNFSRRKFYFLLFFIPGIFMRQPVSAQTDTTADNHCYALCLQPARVIYYTQRILIQPGGSQKVFTPALYSAERNSIQLTPDDTFKIAQPKLYDVKQQNISLTLQQNDSSSISPASKNQSVKTIFVYNQIGLIDVPDYIRRGVSFPVTAFEMISDSDAVLHTFHPVYEVKVKKHLEQNNSQTARYEILCSGKITPGFILALHKALRAKGYTTGNNSKIIDSQTLKALQQYQQDNNLPVGGLNLFTLQQLKVF